VDSGNTPETRGSAFVIYEDIFDAKNACDHLSGFNVCNRYLVVLYYQPNKVHLCHWCYQAFTTCLLMFFPIKGYCVPVSKLHLASKVMKLMMQVN